MHSVYPFHFIFFIRHIPLIRFIPFESSIPSIDSFHFISSAYRVTSMQARQGASRLWACPVQSVRGARAAHHQHQQSGFPVPYSARQGEVFRAKHRTETKNKSAQQLRSRFMYATDPYADSSSQNHTSVTWNELHDPHDRRKRANPKARMYPESPRLSCFLSPPHPPLVDVVSRTMGYDQPGWLLRDSKFVLVASCFVFSPVKGWTQTPPLSVRSQRVRLAKLTPLCLLRMCYRCPS